MTPGATRSIGAVRAALSGPLPSIGAPSASTTRPSSSGPTDTSRMRPVVLTVSPSFRCLYSPSTTAPTESCSRFSASPKVLPGNSSISPYRASASPWTRVMPSVTDMMDPTLRASVTPLKFSIRCLMRSLISVALIAMWVLLCGEFVGNTVETGTERAVDDEIAGAQDSAADQRRVGLAVQPHLTLEPPLERRDDPVAVRLIECGRRGDRDIRHTLGIVLESAEQLGDLGKIAETVVVGERTHEVRALLTEGGCRDVIHQLRQLRGRHARVIEKCRDTRILHHQRRGLQCLRPGREAAVLARLLEGGTRVWAGDRESVCHDAG